MAINSKVDLCNMAQGLLGNFDSSIMDIDNPTTSAEDVYALWYDISRQTFLKLTMPNFSIGRKVVAQIAGSPPYPFTYQYEYPKDCLKLQGIGAVEDKVNNYTVEDNRIYTDILYEDGMPIRYIKDVTDVTSMSPEFKMVFAMFLATQTVMEITQDSSKLNMLINLLPERMSTLSGVNAQENMPIRISRSKFKESRRTGFATDYRKR